MMPAIHQDGDDPDNACSLGSYGLGPIVSCIFCPNAVSRSLSSAAGGAVDFGIFLAAGAVGFGIFLAAGAVGFGIFLTAGRAVGFGIFLTAMVDAFAFVSDIVRETVLKRQGVRGQNL